MKLVNRFAAGLAVLGMLGAAGTVPAAAATAEEAGAFVEASVSEALDALRIPDSRSDERRAAFARIIDDKLDVEAIENRVLGRARRDMSDDQKARFSAVFDDYILNVYVGPLDPQRGYSVEIVRTDRIADDEIVVLTRATPDGGEPLRLDWRLRERPDGRLGIVDVAADGASLLRAKREEFSEIVRREGVDGLIDRIAAVNARTGL